MMSISCIISTYNNPRALEMIIGCLTTGMELPDEIIIADDGSTRETRELIVQITPKSPVHIVHCWHRDKGFRKNRILNIALSNANSDYIIFLDGDCLPHRQFVADHHRLAESCYFVQGRRAFVPERYVEPLMKGTTSIQALAMRFRIKGWFKSLRLPFPIITRNRNMYGLLGCNLAVWHEDLATINGFDEVYEGWGIGEDSDLGARLYNLGRKRKFVYGRALVFHLNHPELPKNHVPASMARLLKTVESGNIQCQRGLNLHQTVHPN